MRVTGRGEARSIVTTVSIHPLLIAGMAILILAIGAGAVAAWLNIQGCPGPRERRLVGLCTLVVWGLIALLLWLMTVLPAPGRYLLLIPYFTLLPWFVYRVSVRRQKLRRLESRAATNGARAAREDDRNQA
jgi:hypothetical protein